MTIKFIVGTPDYKKGIWTAEPGKCFSSLKEAEKNKKVNQTIVKLS